MTPLLLAVLAASPLTPAERAASAKISAAELLGHTRFVASDALEGRGPATRGDALARTYIASVFEQLGLKPGAADGTWFQPVQLVGLTGHPDTLSFQGKGGALTLQYQRDFMAVSGHQQKQVRLDGAEVVFVGYGIVAPEYQWDDFKGVDLAGKVVLVMNNDPEGPGDLFAGRARLWYGRWDYKYEQARKLGAAGCVIIHTTPSAGYPWQVVQTSWAGEQFELPDGGGHRLQLKAWTTEDAARQLVKQAGLDLDVLRAQAGSRAFKPVPLGVKVTTSFPVSVATKDSANVLGVLEGSDPKLKNEVVVFTAHHDHLGRKQGARPGEDDIYNGAVDNAAGVGALLTVARAFASLPKHPKRTLLFASVAAEEQGLLGSEYLVRHPPVPVGRMAADINIDGMNVWGRTRDVSVIGLGKSSIDGVLMQLAKAQGRTVKPDALADRGFFYRSDQFNFARAGVPSAYFASGHDFIGRPEGWGKQVREKWEATHYHQPSDEVTKDWDLSGAVEDVRLYFELGVALANARAMPTWNKGDEFEAARKAALEAAATAP